MEIRGRPEPVTVPCTHCGGQSGLVFFKIYRVIGKKEYSTMLTNEYLKRVYDGLAKRNANEPEFLQAVRQHGR